ncbi:MULTISPECIES: MarR family winged helix-turn-helix transcriptional regulator [unclassified Pseudactinotalea]|uniref:MarR family winged helix-turn-helix transcriptional regulator n=1 Tax=unclassified Pseudactinotalea TaxID=2649176 RepID=UPI00128E151A|nr:MULTISPECIES: MarR family transcriptional regulator [unclassified Pseudactinotalea]MPV48571.1 MarR family transcriptional regulator [Pseudactinotalea sp. HY160]QGH68544.1 MarR family transcriptional regulator [Pseudactinotalea sp. HY158]
MTTPTQPIRRTEPPLATRLRITLLRTSRRLRNESAGTLPEGHLSVLSALFTHGALSPGELAEREHVRPPSMTRTLQHLEGEGYLERATHPTDGRQVVISLSPAGEEYIRETRRRRDQWLQRRLASLTRDQRAILAQAESILREVID